MTLFEMSASGAVLIGVILLLRRGLLYRLPKWTFLLLWGVALCRLLVPFRLPSPVSVYTGAAQVIRAVREEPPSAPVLGGCLDRRPACRAPGAGTEACPPADSGSRGGSGPVRPVFPGCLREGPAPFPGSGPGTGGIYYPLAEGTSHTVSHAN